MGKPTSAKYPTAPADRSSGPDPGAGTRSLLAACRVDTFRSGGKGGQHQNKVETGVRLTHEATGIVATSRRHRSRHRNMEAALRTLERKLADHLREAPPRIPTAVPPGEKRRRREDKLRRSRLKRLRRKPDAGDP